MTAPQKPHDVGNGLVCASFGVDGQWLSMATLDPEAGFVELTGLPQFDPQLRGNEEAVHRYRSWMRREEHAFLHVDAGRARISSRQDAPRSTRGLVQRLVFSAPVQDRPTGIRIRFNGRVGRPALAELREVDPPTDDGPATELEVGDGTLRVSGAGPAVIVQVWLRSDDVEPTDRRPDARATWKLLPRRMPTAIAWIDWPEHAKEVHVDIACTFDLPAPESPDWLSDPVGPVEVTDGPRPLHVPARLVKPLGRMNQRAASYVRTCTALQLDGSERSIVTDHRILPLSKTRDAYWQARLMLATWARGGHDDDANIVADHLRWLFLRCERPDGRWVRSHHADGRRKDHPFAVDQQLYPLLELVEFAATTRALPDLPPDEAWGALVAAAWAAVESAVDEVSGFIRTDEDATDATPAHPFLVSNQVLLWHTASRLADLAPTLGLAKGPFATRAEHVRASVAEHFYINGVLGKQWAHSIDGRGRAEAFMDATDLPVFLAPLWGFCKPNDKVWRTTLAFAFDAANPAFVPGVAGGLGSRLTPGTWTLGDIGRWASAGLAGDTAAADAALGRLVEVAFADGMLPEAYDPEGSGSVARHWFAWPGAALGALVLEHSTRSTGD